MHIKNNIKQGTFYIQGLRSFKDTLPKNVKKILNKKGFTYSQILNKWTYLVGGKISKISFPKGFRPHGKNTPGTLIISVQRGNEVDIEFSKNTIIEKINSYFGYKAIKGIKISQKIIENKITAPDITKNDLNSFNKYINTVKKETGKIKNKNLEESILNLGLSINNKE